MNWQPEAYHLLLKGQYHQVVQFYEHTIQADSETLSNYWYLGLAYLLNSTEEEAQTTWLFALSQSESDELETLTLQLLNILQVEAQRQRQINQPKTAWLIRQHIREINPTLLSNLLELLQLSIQIEEFEPQLLRDWQLVDALNAAWDCDPGYLLSTLIQLFRFPSEEVLEFAQACLIYGNDSDQWLSPLLRFAVEIGEDYDHPADAAKFTEGILKLSPHNINTLKYLSRFYFSAKQYKRAIEVSKQFFSQSQTLVQKFISNFQLLRSLTYAGSWLEIEPIAELHKSFMREIFLTPDTFLDPELKNLLISATGFLAYLQDDLEENRFFHNQVGQLFQKSQPALVKEFAPVHKQEANKKLKIGYIAHTLRNHSVGWLSRWLFQHYDRDRFHFTIYFVNSNFEDDFYRTWFQSQVDQTRSCGLDASRIAENILEDQIDILVDLDSLSFNVTYEVMAFKPAPIQVTWLGWDASGLSAVDYFIADSYVLPLQAQTHYEEKIWHLPQTYIAVDGFEVGVPTLRRTDLDIPVDAVVYLSAQSGAKRHPSTVALQMSIIKQVPNSIFLIKAVGDENVVQDFFIRMAQQEGLNPDRLRFFPWSADEYTHRANLLVADIVLDTYPYNGATTTLETLWMGIPLVTRVGEIFPARNSYAFMMNVGVSEGIAWTDEEYVKWGIRLGKDEELRQQIAWKLEKSKETSPLWNAKKFTREMEEAYRQMWATYSDQGH